MTKFALIINCFRIISLIAIL